ncbi:hypothetical protein [Shewanella xiamenensis]|uniref:hypothetical protein n=1 Tax=Shewanella xiamenensis TaxID=332186 RepID=UPI0004D37E87|nr:hypothetical protein [Shewanella xiamenensis]KEK26533.1 intimin/invasin family protein [Shewanella xiamenensis]
MKCNLIHKAPIWATRLLSTMGLLLTIITPLHAANSVASNETLPAVGRMPILSSPNLPVGPIATGATSSVSDKAIVGVPLTLADMGIDFGAHVLANFSDADGDNEGGSVYEWMIDGVVVSSAVTFVPDVDHGGQLLSVRVIPKTYTGDPNIGSVVTSNKIVVRSSIIDRFSKPDLGHRDWNTASTYCSSILGNGYRLPTRVELQQLYKETTEAISIGSNTQLCQYYGWPLYNQCGGSDTFYWTNEKIDNDSHWGVGMQNGLAYSGQNSYATHITCIK